MFQPEPQQDRTAESATLPPPPVNPHSPEGRLAILDQVYGDGSFEQTFETDTQRWAIDKIGPLYKIDHTYFGRDGDKKLEMYFDRDTMQVCRISARGWDCVSDALAHEVIDYLRGVLYLREQAKK